MIIAPVLDLAREPRFGRIEEGYGEDTYLTGELGKAYVEGVQGKARPGAPETAKHRIAAMVKHFAGFGRYEMDDSALYCLSTLLCFFNYY